MVQELGAVPGPWPGIWSCDYKNLSMIYVHTATASVAVQNGNLQLAEVSNHVDLTVESETTTVKGLLSCQHEAAFLCTQCSS